MYKSICYEGSVYHLPLCPYRCIQAPWLERKLKTEVQKAVLHHVVQEHLCPISCVYSFHNFGQTQMNFHWSVQFSVVQMLYFHERVQPFLPVNIHIFPYIFTIACTCNSSLNILLTMHSKSIQKALYVLLSVKVKRFLYRAFSYC